MPVWCGANALSEAEFTKLEHSNVTRFTYTFANADKATIQSALSTIEEHHPGGASGLRASFSRIDCSSETSAMGR